jgi:hypothetical protein
VSSDYIGLLDTALRYYLGIDASRLNDEEWTLAVARLAEIRKQEKQEKFI